MPNLNKVMLMGNLTRDPNIRHTTKGTPVMDISLAINRYYMSNDGQRREETAFVDVTLWGRHAEIVDKYCSRGKPVYIEGRLSLDSWEDRSTGQQRTKLKVVAEVIQLLGGRDDDPSYSQQNYGGGSGGYQGQQQQAPQQQQQQQSQPPAYQAPPQQSPRESDEDIPF